MPHARYIREYIIYLKEEAKKISAQCNPMPYTRNFLEEYLIYIKEDLKISAQCKNLREKIFPLLKSSYLCAEFGEYINEEIPPLSVSPTDPTKIACVKKIINALYNLERSVLELENVSLDEERFTLAIGVDAFLLFKPTIDKAAEAIALINEAGEDVLHILEGVTQVLSYCIQELTSHTDASSLDPNKVGHFIASSLNFLPISERSKEEGLDDICHILFSLPHYLDALANNEQNITSLNLPKKYSKKAQEANTILQELTNVPSYHHYTQSMKLLASQCAELINASAPCLKNNYERLLSLMNKLRHEIIPDLLAKIEDLEERMLLRSGMLVEPALAKIQEAYTFLVEKCVQRIYEIGVQYDAIALKTKAWPSSIRSLLLDQDIVIETGEPLVFSPEILYLQDEEFIKKIHGKRAARYEYAETRLRNLKSQIEPTNKFLRLVQGISTGIVSEWMLEDLSPQDKRLLRETYALIKDRFSLYFPQIDKLLMLALVETPPPASLVGAFQETARKQMRNSVEQAEQAHTTGFGLITNAFKNIIKSQDVPLGSKFKNLVQGLQKYLMFVTQEIAQCHLDKRLISKVERRDRLGKPFENLQAFRNACSIYKDVYRQLPLQTNVHNLPEPALKQLSQAYGLLTRRAEAINVPSNLLFVLDPHNLTAEETLETLSDSYRGLICWVTHQQKIVSQLKEFNCFDPQSSYRSTETALIIYTPELPKRFYDKLKALGLGEKVHDYLSTKLCQTLSALEPRIYEKLEFSTSELPAHDSFLYDNHTRTYVIIINSVFYLGTSLKLLESLSDADCFLDDVAAVVDLYTALAKNVGHLQRAMSNLKNSLTAQWLFNDLKQILAPLRAFPQCFSLLQSFDVFLEPSATGDYVSIWQREQNLVDKNLRPNKPFAFKSREYSEEYDSADELFEVLDDNVSLDNSELLRIAYRPSPISELSLGRLQEGFYGFTQFLEREVKNLTLDSVIENFFHISEKLRMLVNPLHVEEDTENKQRIHEFLNNLKVLKPRQPSELLCLIRKIPYIGKHLKVLLSGFNLVFLRGPKILPSILYCIVEIHNKLGLINRENKGQLLKLASYSLLNLIITELDKVDTYLAMQWDYLASKYIPLYLEAYTEMLRQLPDVEVIEAQEQYYRLQISKNRLLHEKESLKRLKKEFASANFQKLLCAQAQPDAPRVYWVEQMEALLVQDWGTANQINLRHKFLIYYQALQPHLYRIDITFLGYYFLRQLRTNQDFQTTIKKIIKLEPKLMQYIHAQDEGLRFLQQRSQANIGRLEEIVERGEQELSHSLSEYYQACYTQCIDKLELPQANRNELGCFSVVFHKHLVKLIEKQKNNLLDYLPIEENVSHCLQLRMQNFYDHYLLRESSLANILSYCNKVLCIVEIELTKLPPTCEDLVLCNLHAEKRKVLISITDSLTIAPNQNVGERALRAKLKQAQLNLEEIQQYDELFKVETAILNMINSLLKEKPSNLIKQKIRILENMQEIICLEKPVIERLQQLGQYTNHKVLDTLAKHSTNIILNLLIKLWQMIKLYTVGGTNSYAQNLHFICRKFRIELDEEQEDSQSSSFAEEGSPRRPKEAVRSFLNQGAANTGSKNNVQQLVLQSTPGNREIQSQNDGGGVPNTVDSGHLRAAT
jgi:hypothetical protein